MEHMESVDIIKKTIDGCYYLLKSKGILEINVPIYSHGLDIFVEYNKSAIENIFSKHIWEIIRLEEWRNEHFPLEIYDPNKTGKSEFILQIECVKL
jgi:predicted SAM-dependent methyltransferase